MGYKKGLQDFWPGLELWLKATQKWPIYYTGMIKFTFFCPVPFPLTIFTRLFSRLPFIQSDYIFLTIPTREGIMKFWRVSHRHACRIEFLRVLHDILINNMVRVGPSGCPATLERYPKDCPSVPYFMRST